MCSKIERNWNTTHSATLLRFEFNSKSVHLYWFVLPDEWWILEWKSAFSSGSKNQSYSILYLYWKSICMQHVLFEGKMTIEATCASCLHIAQGLTGSQCGWTAGITAISNRDACRLLADIQRTHVYTVDFLCVFNMDLSKAPCRARLAFLWRACYMNEIIKCKFGFL